MTASSWLDDYFSWIDPTGKDPCCRMLHKRETECTAVNVTRPGNTTVAPNMKCFNYTVPVSPPQFCNATGKTTELRAILSAYRPSKYSGF